MAARTQLRDNLWHIGRFQFRQDEGVDERRGFLVGHADVTRPIEHEQAVGGGLTEREAKRGLERVGDLQRPFHDGDRRLGQTDPKGRLGRSRLERIKGHGVLDFDDMNAEALGNGGHGHVVDLAEALLHREHDVQEPVSVGREHLDDIFDCGRRA